MDSYSGVGTFSTALYGDAIVEKVGALLARPEERVFLLASWQTPHQPLSTPPATRYPKLSAAWNLLDWNMYALDVEVGRVLALMRRNATVWNNTVVLFFSDNLFSRFDALVRGARVSDAFAQRFSWQRLEEFKLAQAQSAARFALRHNGQEPADRLLGATRALAAVIKVLLDAREKCDKLVSELFRDALTMSI
jgi:hypothetical protein